MIESQSATVPAAASGSASASRRPTRSGAKTGEIKEAEQKSSSSTPRRHVSRTPARSASHQARPSVVLGGVPHVAEPKKKSIFFRSDAPRVRTIRAQKHTPFPFGTLFVLLLCTGLFMYMVYNFVEINEYSMNLKAMQSNLDQLTKQQQTLELQLENRNDLTLIAGIAENTLGMVKLDEVSKEYLDGSKEDKVEVSQISKEKQAQQVSAFSVLLNAIVQNFRDLAEYID